MKADLHCHSQYSYDSIAKIEEIIKEAETKGLDAVAVTDHDNARAWKEIKKTDFPIILGEEIKTNKGDVLGLFLKQEINGRQKDPRWVMEEIKKNRELLVEAAKKNAQRKNSKINLTVGNDTQEDIHADEENLYDEEFKPLKVSNVTIADQDENSQQ